MRPPAAAAAAAGCGTAGGSRGRRSGMCGGADKVAEGWAGSPQQCCEQQSRIELKTVLAAKHVMGDLLNCDVQIIDHVQRFA